MNLCKKKKELQENEEELFELSIDILCAEFSVSQSIDYFFYINNEKFIGTHSPIFPISARECKAPEFKIFFFYEKKKQISTTSYVVEFKDVKIMYFSRTHDAPTNLRAFECSKNEVRKTKFIFRFRSHFFSNFVSTCKTVERYKTKQNLMKTEKKFMSLGLDKSTVRKLGLYHNFDFESKFMKL